MARFLPVLGLGVLLAGCAVYPDGSIGPLPPAGVTVPPPVPAVPYSPPSYAYGATDSGVPVYVVPQQPPPMVVSPSIGIGLGWGWGWGGWGWGGHGYWGGPRGYWGHPYRWHH